MKIKANRASLLTACQMVAAATATRSPKAILTSIKAEATGGDASKLTLLATDLEMGLRYEVLGVEIQEPGDAILPPAKLIAILRESPDEEIVLESDSKATRVTTFSSEFEMPCEDPATFPMFNGMDEAGAHRIQAGVLSDMIARTEFATAKNDTKYAVTSVLVETEAGMLRLVGTDTRRLSLATGAANISDGAKLDTQTLVPVRAFNLLQKLLKDEGQDVLVKLSNNDATFKVGDATIWTRLMEGRYPPYRDIIPKKVSFAIELPIGAFLTAVKQAKIMTDNDTKRCSFEFTDKKLTIKAQGASTGRSKVEMPLDYDGKDISVNFDPDFVIEFLKVLDSGSIVLNMETNQKPAVFKVGDNFTHLVMPLT